MANNNLDSQIRECIDGFVAEISDLVRQAALDAVGSALGGQTSAAAPRRRAAAPRPAAAPRAAGGKRKRIRRSAEDLAKVGDEILAHVKANAGCRMEEISKALGAETKDLRRPIQELVGQKALKTKGQKRATQYFAGAAGARKKKGKRAA